MCPFIHRSYGGWVAPNIYYLGNAGVVNFGGLRIAGLSGIYKEHDFRKSECKSVLSHCCVVAIVHLSIRSF